MYPETFLKALPTTIQLLTQTAEESIERFPLIFDKRIFKGIERLLANAPEGFVETRSLRHLRKILLVQFFLQKRMEACTQTQQPFFLKLFRSKARICLALTCPSTNVFQPEQLFKSLQSFLCSIQEMPHSSYKWYHPQFPYFFCYFEAHKLRGADLTFDELKKVERALREQLLATSPPTPALFWPYNEEESYRQIQILRREMGLSQNLPHVSILFQKQTLSSLEFLIHLVQPLTSAPLDQLLQRLPNSLEVFCYNYSIQKKPFPTELGIFSLKVPSKTFEIRDSINLLYARRYISKHLEKLIGPFRDYNGSLFMKLQQHFETIRVPLSDKIPYFDLFAEKLFYALHPVERRLLLSLFEAEELFSAFSRLLQDENIFIEPSRSGKFVIFKTVSHAEHPKEIPRVSGLYPSLETLAELTLGGVHYLCCACNSSSNSSFQIKTTALKSEKKLSLVFEEGAPPSLNPYHSLGDMRSRLITKLLFEGLTRLKEGTPLLAGAKSLFLSPDGLQYTFKLREALWSNGEKITAFDYAKSWHYALQEQVSHPEFFFVLKNGRKYKEERHPLGIYALDVETLQINLEWPDPHFLYKLAHPSFSPLFGSFREPKWFNGPYLLREESKEGILLERNPYYWESERLHFDQIHIQWLDDIQQIYSLFKSRRVDWIGDPISYLSPPLIHQLEQDDLLKKREVSRRFLIYFNTKHPLLESHLIRQALSLSIPRGTLCNEFFPYSTPIAPTEALPEEANHLFEQGLKYLGLTRQSFPTLTFSYSHPKRREKMAFTLQAAWQKILGIKVNVESVEWNLFRSKLEKGFFEIAITIQENVHENSYEFLDRFEGSSSWNFSQWSHPHYRHMLQQYTQENDPSKREEILLKAKKILEDAVPFTPLFNYTHLYAQRSDLQGITFDQEGCIDFSWSHLLPLSN